MNSLQPRDDLAQITGTCEELEIARGRENVTRRQAPQHADATAADKAQKCFYGIIYKVGHEINQTVKQAF